MNTELIELNIEEVDYPEVYKTGGLKIFFDKIKEKATSEVLDASTPEGRKRIAKLANMVAKSKTLIEKKGRAYNKGIKEESKLIDIEIKWLVDNMNELKAEVRAPLTEFEQVESQRRQDLDDRLSALEYLARERDDGCITPLNIDELNANLFKLQGIVIDDTWQEDQKLVTDKRERFIRTLTKHIELVCADNAKEEEIEQLKRVAAEKEQLLREQNLVSEAKHEAEVKASVEAAHAKHLAEQEKLRAIEDERKRIYDDEMAKSTAEALRQGDKQNMRFKNYEALNSFIENGYTVEQGKAIIVLIVKGEIANVTINY